MHPIPTTQCHQWSIYGKIHHPGSVDTTCPHCHKAVSLKTEGHQNDLRRSAVSSTGSCPRCAQPTSFWSIRISQDAAVEKSTRVYMFPAPAQLTPTFKPGDIGNTRLESVCQNAFNAYNDGHWEASATTCRKALEGILKLRYPNEKGMLGALLKQAAADPSLLKPLMDLTTTLKDGGNAAAHFDESVEEYGRDSAAAMLELLDFVIEYLFLAQKKADEIKRRLNPETPPAT